MDAVLAAIPNFPPAYMLRYINAMRTNNYTRALENLHKFFDMRHPAYVRKRELCSHTFVAVSFSACITSY